MIVATSGCFDILHAGHVDFLARCAKHGKLIVFLNSDASVRKLKGKQRPINNQKHRKYILEQLKCVHKVYVFNEQTPVRLIQKFRPRIYFKGNDYKPKLLVEFPVVQAYNGRVKILSFKYNISTTKIVNKILDNK